MESVLFGISLSSYTKLQTPKSGAKHPKMVLFIPHKNEICGRQIGLHHESTKCSAGISVFSEKKSCQLKFHCLCPTLNSFFASLPHSQSQIFMKHVFIHETKLTIKTGSKKTNRRMRGHDEQEEQRSPEEQRAPEEQRPQEEEQRRVLGH